MGNEFAIEGNVHGTLAFEYLPCINYAMVHNRIATCLRFALTNHDGQAWNDLYISLTGEELQTCELRADSVPAGQTVSFETLKIQPEANRLLTLSEGIHSDFLLTIRIGEETAYEQRFPIYLMAFDQWTGLDILPELLASFVTPNHPLLSRVAVNASRFLEQWTGSSALDEYQTQNPNRVRQQVAALYEALRAESLVYATIPAGFEQYGQRVRLVDKVLNEKLATCLDLTLLFASCLESVGIHPLLVVMNGHAFVGAWLTSDMYAKSIGEDAAYLLKGCADGINDMVLVETTALTSSSPVSFEEAVGQALDALRREEEFRLFIDVWHCRFEGIRPLPVRVMQEGVWQIENEGVEHVNATHEVSQLSRYDLKLDDSTAEVTKQAIWERKLLDFSLRNNLINMRLGRKVIPFISFSIDRLEDQLQAGDTYQILPLPVKEEFQPDGSGIYDSQLYKQQLEELILQEGENRRLHSYLHEVDLQAALKHLYRESRTALEENGANALFLVLGVLKWYETAKSERPRFAPILLLPVDIVRKRGGLGYVIRSREEDIILNITLVELLKQQFGITLSSLHPLPKDENGVDVKQIFAILRACLREQKGWDVVEEAMLGLFSFSKFVMWNDIHTNADKLRENPVVASLMENRIVWTDTGEVADAREADREVEPARFAIPVSVDSSQLEAVIESGAGKSFILHGPPGTGKSQTITNMIANALFQGKRVLFVAEKMAALSVVQRRLARIGLDPFCLELHSNKVTKSHFLKQMERALNVTHIKSPADYEKTSEALFERRKSLIAYMEALHAVQHERGLSLYDCLSGYLSIEGDELEPGQKELDCLSADEIRRAQELLQEVDVIVRVTDHPQDHPLAGLYPRAFTSERRDSLQTSLQQYAELLEEWTECRRYVAGLLQSACSDDRVGMEHVARLMAALLNLPLLNLPLLEEGFKAERMVRWRELAQVGRKRDEARNYLSRLCSSSFLEEDSFLLKQEWKAIQEKWILLRFIASRRFLRRLRRFAPALHLDEVVPLLDHLEQYQQHARAIDEERDSLTRLFGPLVPAGKEQWDEVEKLCQALPDCCAALHELSDANRCDLRTLCDILLKRIDGRWELFLQTECSMFCRVVQLQERFVEAEENLLSQLMPEPFDGLPLTERLPVVQRWLAHFSLFNDWTLWCRHRQTLQEAGLRRAVTYIEQHHKSGQEAANAYRKGAYHKLSLRLIDENEMLSMFNGVIFEEQINKYRQLTRTFQELSKQELYCRLAARIPSLTMEASATSEVGILKRNIGNGGRGTSIRRIIDQIPTLLPKLCPCMLMSPISVAQYLDLNNDKFDLVIFDEASQMPTSEAVGAIARGKSLVVVGDPKQMPPTSFFATSQVDEEEAAFDDMESILDDCISLSMPSRYLTWHYRSKHESLIAFSNAQYYEGKLHTFPSVDDRTSKVTLVQIEGTYDKGRTRSNRSEAEAIVQEVIRRLSDKELSRRSIGIVSFSKVQQNLIEDILTEELAKRPELEELAYQGDEPIFIKNLENVQGDERDVILFSIGYGPDKYGRVSMNFGPLNNSGGERRLNVAVSRSRYEMMVFSTLRAEQIDLRRTKAVGVEGLKKFLEFAERGTSVVAAGQVQAGEESSLVTQIADELNRQGYQVDTYVGRSNFKIDLAVIDPADASRYLLGILCDGKNYYETKTTRDRELVQPSVLQLLDWNIMRVWSIDWFSNRRRVMKRILSLLDDIRRQQKRKGTVQLPLSAIPEPVKKFNVEAVEQEVVKNRCRPYHCAPMRPSRWAFSVEDVLAAKDKVKEQLAFIIAAEQPVNNLLLYKRIAQVWGLQRATPRIQALIDTLLKDQYRDELEMPGGVVTYWKSAAHAQNYAYYRADSSREVQEVPVVEFMNALLDTLEQQGSLPREDLKRFVAHLLGFARKGVAVDAGIEQAMELLESEGKIRTDNETVQLAPAT